ncbi:cyclodeaminase/cyclohydrolase family protein [Peptococcaceae bacterium 1198_IL3148]
MNDIFDQSFRKILYWSASDSPTPGGGSVSAMIGALGTAMAIMVGNLTIGKKKYAAVEAETKEITGQAYYILTRLEKLVAADVEVFNHFMQCYQMPKNSEEQKAIRQEELQKALKNATEVPLQIAALLLESLAIAEKIARIGNKMAISDAGVAAYTCEAALNAVLLNVDINTPMISDQDFVSEVKTEKIKIIEEAKKLKELTIATVNQRINE